jgi:hypothetical protein
LERQAETVLQNQLEATQIELRNHINTEKQKGILEVAKVEQEGNFNINRQRRKRSQKRNSLSPPETLMQSITNP